MLTRGRRHPIDKRVTRRRPRPRRVTFASLAQFAAAFNRAVENVATGLGRMARNIAEAAKAARITTPLTRDQLALAE